MGLIAVTGSKGSPGVTTTAVALAAVWPRPAVLADCDPAGGDVALRLAAPDGRPLRRDIGLLGLAAQLRTGGPHGLSGGEHLQLAAGGLSVLAGVSTPSQAAALAPLWPGVATALKTLGDDGEDTIVDCGRYLPDGFADAVLAAADVIVVVARATVEGVTHLRGLLAGMPVGDGRHVSAAAKVVVIDKDPTAAAEVEHALRAGGCAATVAGAIAFDPIGAAGLAGIPTRRLDRTPLIGSARRLAVTLDGLLAVAHAPHRGEHATTPALVAPADLRPPVFAITEPSAAVTAEPAGAS